jgi:hypothetical protein
MTYPYRVSWPFFHGKIGGAMMHAILPEVRRKCCHDR